MIIVTGAAGFIASCLVSKLNQEGFKDIVLVDDFSNIEKNKNFEGKTYSQQVDRAVFVDWLKENEHLVQFVFHIGARTDTTEFNVEIFRDGNFFFRRLPFWAWCVIFTFF